MNPTTPEPAEALRDADRIERGERRVTYVWDLAPDPDGGTRQAILAISHDKRGRGGGTFTATILNRTEDRNETRMGDILTSWLCIAAQPTARYSKQGLDAFAADALRQLREKHHSDEDDGQRLQRYFQPQAEAA
jgi:hypothetical protein